MFLLFFLLACGPDTADISTVKHRDTGTRDTADTAGDTAPDTGADTDTGADSGVDTAVDTAPADPCATPSGHLELATTGMAISVYGTGTICSVACSASWVRLEVTEGGDATPLPLPREVTDSTVIWIRRSDPGAPSSATCEIYTSAGTFPLPVEWSG